MINRTVKRMIATVTVACMLMAAQIAQAATDCNLVTEIPTTECQSLLDLYNSTNGAGWTDKTGWNDTDTPCSWFGVICSSGHISTVNLPNNQLVGTLPNLNLPSLTQLQLYDNQLTGSIPNFNMPNLTQLYLHTNQLSGTIPDFNMPSLTVLYLSTNQLSGTIPNFNMPNLTGLYLNTNQLSGTIPNFNMPNLTKLRLHTNQLTGTIPNFNMPNMTELQLYTNQLSGTIPSFNMPNMTYLALSDNQLSGTIPNFNMPNMTNLALGTNQLSGTIPNFNMPSLTRLYLPSNQLSGVIPNFNMPNLTNLTLNTNQLSGTVPNLNFSGFTTLLLNNNCGLTAYDAAQAAVLTAKDSIWQQVNTVCPTNCNLVTEIPTTECQSLVDLYNSTNGSGWTDKTGWNVTTTPCSWFGVTCSGGHVATLELNSNQLAGNIPNLNLPNLTILSLHTNQLSGSIPNFNMPNMLSLRLYTNQLSGNIPNFDMPNMTSLYLDTNQLSGNIPNFNMPNLDYLGLSNNQLTGTIPNFNMPNLTRLQLHHNLLTGTIPNFNMPNLTILGLNDNQLSGSIPNFNMPNMTSFSLHHNQLTGAIPNFNMPNLTSLQFNDNQLSGTIPNFSMPNMISFSLYNNQLTGTIPNFNMPNLINLALYNNQLSGSIPNFNMPNLSAIGLSNNQLSGAIPNFNMPNLNHLGLAINQLSGTIPNFNMPNLTYFGLSNNQLSGIIPNFNFFSSSTIRLSTNCSLTAYDAAQAAVLTAKDPTWQTVNPVCPTNCNLVTEIPATECQSLVDLYNSTNGSGWTTKTGWNATNTPCSWFGVTCSGGNVRTLNLQSNQLVGTIPNLNLPALTQLRLNTNQLTGTIPNFNMSNLISLQLFNNQLSGTIPDFNMPNLTSLQLYNNQLSGSIPNFNMPNLTSLQLFNNQLSGSIPNFNMPNLTQLSLDTNQLSGSIPNFNMPILTSLRLYSNQLSGTIPNFNMPNLTGLYLNYNQLSGTIPDFNMPNMTHIGLNNNQLSGVIPNFNMPNLTYLGLSTNQLSGAIPNFNLPSLTSLQLGNNQLSGAIPNFNLPNLTNLNLQVNQLSGTIPNLNFSGITTVLLNNNCGLTAYDAAQAAVLTGKDSIWQQLNSVCFTPAITLSAASGKAGDSVIITASNFTSLTSPAVTFGSSNVTPVVSGSTLTVTVPAGVAAVTVTVTSGGQSASTGFNYVTLPGYTVNFTVNPAVGGTVNLSSQTVVSGAQTSPVTATPTTGYTFSYWKDQGNAIVSTDATLPAQTVTRNMTYTAYFSTASGTTYTWTGADTGNPTGWFIAGNWSPTGIPQNAADSVIIQAVTVNHYPLLQNAVILNKFDMAAGASLTITSPGNLQVNDTADMNGTITLENSGNIQVPPSGIFSINTGGVLKINGGGVQIDAGGAQYRFRNLGTIEWQNGSIDPVYLSGTLPCYFNNEGNILISGTGANLKDCIFTNSGRFILAPDTTLAVSNGSFTNVGLIELPLNSYIHFTVSSTLTNKGTLKGRGTLSGSYFTLVNEGIVDPGWSDAGILYSDPLNISGNYTQTSTGKLHIDANALGNDFIYVTGTTQLGGTVEFVPFGNFTPSGSFDVVKSDGSMSDTLTLMPLTGYMLTKNIVSGTPNIFRISIGRSGYIWSGAGSDNWAEAGNWAEGTVPALLTDSVTIPANCPNYPHINSDVQIGRITIESGASLTIHSGFSFNIHGDSTNNGTLTLQGGNVILNNAVFTNNGDLIFFTPEGATSEFADAPASQGKLINTGMIVNQSFAGVIDVFNFEQIPTDSGKGISIQGGEMRFASGDTQNTYIIGASSFSGNGILIFGGDNPDKYPMIMVRDNLNINVLLKWFSGVVEPESGITTQITMTLSKNAEISSAVFKKLYGMDLSIISGSVVTLKDGEFYLGNSANFKVDGGILSVEGKMSFYNYDTDAALTGTVVNNGIVRGTGILSFAPNAGDPKPPVVFTNNLAISPGLSPGLLTLDMGSSVYDHSSGTLNIEISSNVAVSGYDRLHVIGNVKLGGTLNVTADSAYVPHDGDIFDILTMTGTGLLTGQFSSVNLPNIPEFHWEPVSYVSPVRLTLRQNTSSILTVTVDPADSGTVSGGGITCPAVCSKEIDSAAASSINLNASANPGYVFDHWEIGNNTAAGTDPVSLIVDFPANSMMTQAVKAVFKPKTVSTYKLSVSVSPGGAGSVSVTAEGSSGSTCSPNCSFPAGTKISLFPMPNSGYHFMNWSGAVSGSSASAEVIINSDKSVTAYFQADIIYYPSDYCPDDPNKTEPGKCGCGKPETENCIEDLCPNDPKKTEPGKCGCGKPETENCIQDNCPNDPNKTEPGKCGCGKPETENCIEDLCPNDPNKTEPGKCGCGKPETENCIQDNCPNDPNKTAPGKCGCGIPDTDSKGDGIADCLRGDPPKRPALLNPGFNEIIPQNPVILRASAFSADGNQTHIETHWLTQRADLLYRTAKGALFNDHTVNSGNMTEFEFENVSPGMKYIWKAGYKASGNIKISWSDESTFIVGIPEQSPVTEIPGGETAAQYRMFSFPYWIQNEDAVAVLSAVIGSYDPKMVRIGAYDANISGYTEYGEGMKIIPGKAYWILSRNGVKLSVTGIPVSLNHTMEVILDNGWNMIAPPNNADYEWNKVEIVVYDDNLKVVYGPSPVSASDSQKYIDILWQWQNGDYAPANTLEKNRGYWVKAKQPGVVLQFSESARGKSATRSEKRSSSAEKPPMPMENTAFTINTDSADAAGGCFIDSAAQR